MKFNVRESYSDNKFAQQDIFRGTQGKIEL